MNEQADQNKTSDSDSLERWVRRLRHLFGQHNSSCRVAGAWSMKTHKKLRGRFAQQPECLFCCRKTGRDSRLT